MVKKTGLGKGLDALFSDNLKKEEITKEPVKEINGEIVRQIKITEIEPNRDQPRKKFDEDKLDELAESIKNYGVIQPIIVMPKEGYYQIIAGERRWRAAKKAGLTEMPCLVRTKTEQENREIALIENMQRENLNVIERARGLKQLLDDYGLTQQQLADRLGVSRSGITNHIRILNLDPRVIDLVLEHNFSERQCRALMRMEDPEKQLKLAEKIVIEGNNSDDLDRIINNEKIAAEKRKKKTQEKYRAIYKDIEDSFQGFFGTKVKLQAGVKKGKIVIEYNSNDDLERILGLIK